MITSHQIGNPKIRRAGIQMYARLAGVLFFISLVAGGFGEAYVPSTLIVAGNATATAHNIIASDLLFRLSFLGWLIEAICDVALALVFYVLLRAVHEHIALGAVFFRLMATAIFAVAELFYFVPLLILGGQGYLKTFSPDQLHGLMQLSLDVYSFAGSISSGFYGIASLLFGYLMYRSGYLPRVLGVLLALGGLGFLTATILQVLAPAYASSIFMVPIVLAGLVLALWLLIRGVDVGKWSETKMGNA